MFEGENAISFSASQNKVLYFGKNIFVNKFINRDCCFVCGDSPKSKEFNNEHVIPDWLLRKHKLHSSSITLPNGTKLPYGMYTIPCCKECNSELGRVVETPISQLLSRPYSEIINELRYDETLIHDLFHWLCLVYIKTHLKDNALLLNRDKRQKSGSIGDSYDWEEMHHIHCMARRHFTNPIIQPGIYGTVFILPALILEQDKSFDYADHTASKTVMLQSGEFCIIAVLNDSCAGQSIYGDHFKRISSAVTPFQIRNIMAHLNFINLNLTERPSYFSGFTQKGEYTIGAVVPEYFNLQQGENRVASFGEFLHFYVDNIMGDIPNRETILDEIRAGKRNYLFNESGEFIDHSESVKARD